MICEICEKINPPLLIEIPQKRGNRDTNACVSCAEKSGLYCLKHKKAYTEFPDGSTACRDCVEDRFIELKPKADLFLRDVKYAAPHGQFTILTLNARQLAKETDFSISESVLRLLVARALRNKKSEVDIIKEISLRKKVDFLFY